VPASRYVSDYVVGADGGRSAVRKALGIEWFLMRASLLAK
jgi:2-polyprenyl-6-methoxyphenol hydroxylase-like FAD-dependent oxidoreductase